LESRLGEEITKATPKSGPGSDEVRMVRIFFRGQLVGDPPMAVFRGSLTKSPVEGQEDPDKDLGDKRQSPDAHLKEKDDKGDDRAGALDHGLGSARCSLVG